MAQHNAFVFALLRAHRLADQQLATVTERVQSSVGNTAGARSEGHPTVRKIAFTSLPSDREVWGAQNLLLAKQLSDCRSVGALLSAIDHLHHAIDLVPEFACVRAGLAEAYCLISEGCGVAPVHTLIRAREAAYKALQLDPSCGAAAASLGFVKWTLDHAWAAAERHFTSAIRNNPDY